MGEATTPKQKMEGLKEKLQYLLLENVMETGEEIGRGAYGVVYKVKVSGLICAGKKLHNAIIQESTLLKFIEECICHSQQRHPNVVQLMGIHYQNDSVLPLLVMEYLPISLTQCLEAHVTLPLQIKCSVLLDVAKGLNYLHCKKPPIVHRDITANNVLLTLDFAAKISDLGVSRMVDSFQEQKLTTTPGNAIVMPPEALEETPRYDQKLDVFSYGCLILHVLTHQWPVPAKQFIVNDEQPTLYKKISEWKRRMNYIQMIPKKNPLLSLAKICLFDDFKMRPEMDSVMQHIENAICSMPLLKNKLELLHEIHALQEESKYQITSIMTKYETNIALTKEQYKSDIATLQKLCEDKEEQISNLLDELQPLSQKLESTQKQLDQLKEFKAIADEKLRMAGLEKVRLYKVLNAKKNEFIEQTNLLLEHQEESSKLLSERDHEIEKLKQEIVELKEGFESKLEFLLMEKYCKVIKCKDETIECLKEQLLPPDTVDYKEHKKVIKPLMSQEFKEGDVWYLVDYRWFKQWKQYTNFDVDDDADCDNDRSIESDYPGPVDNQGLLETVEIGVCTLKEQLILDMDFALLPEPVWNLLIKYYGLSVGSQAIERKVVECDSYLNVEIYLLSLKLSLYSDMNDFKVSFFSRVSKVGTIVEKTKELFGLCFETECRLWKRVVRGYELLSDLNKAIYDVGMYGGQLLILERRNSDGTWSKQ